MKLIDLKDVISDDYYLYIYLPCCINDNVFYDLGDFVKPSEIIKSQYSNYIISFIAIRDNETFDICLDEVKENG